ncbi:outer membrane protein [Bradyrhizobium sp. B120]|uniref:outer membrane protein n=1 Tax=Bradyrhizobium sp. B120 TaxID=3410088 RepID=UPI003B9856A5
MRRFLLAAMMFGAVTGAQAADMPDFLRGSLPASSAPTRNWDGWYAGGQVGQTWINTDFGGSVASLTNSIFRNTTLQGPTSQFNLLGRVNAQSSGFGAFVGRNYQFDDVVVGVEANYTYWSGLTTTTSGSLGPIQVAQPTLVLPAGASAADGVTLNGSAALKLKDEMTFRGRAGWATGDFLPYVFGGLAVGRMDVSRTVTSSVDRTINFANGSSTTFALPQLAQTATDAKTDAYVAGWTAGLGLEYMLWNCVFVRGEWEYVKFSPVKNTSVTQNSVRAAIGYKF